MRCRHELLALSLGLLACTQTGEADAQVHAQLSEQLERTNARVDELEQRLAAIDAQLEAKPAPAPPVPVAGDDVPPSTAAPTIDPAALDRGISCAGDRCTIQAWLWTTLLGETAALSHTVRIVPAVRGDEQVGYKLYGIRPQSLAARLGFKNGDLLLTIDGKHVTSVAGALDIYADLVSASEFVVGFERKGEARRLTVMIAGR